VHLKETRINSIEPGVRIESKVPNRARNTLGSQKQFFGARSTSGEPGVLLGSQEKLMEPEVLPGSQEHFYAARGSSRKRGVLLGSREQLHIWSQEYFQRQAL
jgi:hypothetical protein